MSILFTNVLVILRTLLVVKKLIEVKFLFRQFFVIIFKKEMIK